MAKAQKRRSKKNGTEPELEQELRLTPLERAELDLCDRDYENSRLSSELATEKLRNLEMDFQGKKSRLVEAIKTWRAKTEQMALIRNRKLAEIESRLRSINSEFSFKDYLEQADGTLVPSADKIAAMDPTEEDSGGSLMA